MITLPQISSQLQTLLTATTDTLAQDQSYVKRPDRARLTPSSSGELSSRLGWAPMTMGGTMFSSSDLVTFSIRG